LRAIDVLQIVETTVDDDKVRIHPPFKVDASELPTVLDQLDPTERQVEEFPKIDDNGSISANAFRIDVLRDSFDRPMSGGAPVPEPVALAFKVLNALLSKMRMLNRSHVIDAHLDPHADTWVLRYLDDDESELPQHPDLVRGRAGRSHRFNLTVLHEALWQAIHRLPTIYEQPPTYELLLDAIHALPDMGPAVVLAATALEIKVTSAVDILAKNTSHDAMWQWLRKRGEADYTKSVSYQERFELIHIICNRSLAQEDQILWKSFIDLKYIRNKFVHEGRLVLKRAKRIEAVTLAEVTELVHRALTIADWIDQLLPASERVPAMVVASMKKFEFAAFAVSPKV
jgi:hypothetical protein